MKYIINLSICLLTMVFLTSCEEEDYTAPYGDFSSFTWWVSPKDTYNEIEKTVSVNKYLAFKDLSRGAISHEWRIPKGSRFLNSNFKETDTIYTPFIIPNGGVVTSESIAYVLFTEVGVHEVQLVNTFEESVTGATNVEGTWKAEQTFTITVID